MAMVGVGAVLVSCNMVGAPPLVEEVADGVVGLRRGACGWFANCWYATMSSFDI